MHESPIILLSLTHDGRWSWWRDSLVGAWDVKGNWPAFIHQTYARGVYHDMIGTFYGVPVYRRRDAASVHPCASCGQPKPIGVLRYHFDWYCLECWENGGTTRPAPAKRAEGGER